MIFFQILHRVFILLLTIISSLIAFHSASCPPPPEVATSDIAYNTSGSGNSSLDYFYIGGLFAIHESGNNLYECGNGVRERGIVNMEAFFWAVSTFPSRKGLLKDLSIRAFAFDTCSSEAILANKLLNLENCVIGYAPTGHPAIEQSRVYGYVGPEGQTEAIKAANILSSKEKILVSNAANTPEIDSENINNYFLRAVPSAESEIKVIYKIIQAFGVSNIQIVYSDSMKGMLDLLEDALHSSNNQKYVTTVNKQEILEDNAISVVNGLLIFKQYYLVILLTNPEETIKFFEATKRKNVKGVFTYVGTSALSTMSSIFSQYEDEARGLVSTSFGSPSAEGMVDLKTFNDFLKNNPSNNHNPWIRQYFQQTGVTEIRGSDPFIHYTIAAADAILTGIHKVKQKKCGSRGLCSSMTGAVDLAGDIQAEMLDPNEELFDPNTKGQFDPQFDILHLRSPVQNGYVKVSMSIIYIDHKVFTNDKM